MNVLSERRAAGAPAAPAGPFFLDRALIARQRRAGEGLWRAEVMEGRSAIEALADEWRALQARAAADTQAFQSHGWCAAWAQTCLDDRREEPLIVTVRRGGELVLLWPLMRTRLGPLRAIVWLSDPFCQYGDVISSLKGDDLAHALGLAWREIRDAGRADLIRLRHVRADAVAAPFLRHRARLAGVEEGAPWLDLTAFADEAAYEARYTRSQRRRRRKIRQRLEKARGQLAFARLDDGEEMRRAIARLVAQKRAWLAARGLYSRPIAHRRLEVFFIRLMEAGGDGAARLVVSQTSANGEGIAWELGLRFKGRHYAYITAHDHTLTDLSPGRLHMDFSQRLAVTDGMRAFDLLVPAAPHKKSWSSSVAVVRDYYLPLSVKGRVIGGGYLRLFRPLARHVYAHLPAGLRRRLGLDRLAGAGHGEE